MDVRDDAGSSLDVETFTRDCESLRASGCRCMLRWDERLGAVPLIRAEAAQLRCPVHFIED